MEKEQELRWDMLPDGLSEYFDIELHEKTEKYFRITLIEKNIVPNLSKEYQGKPIINTVIKPIIIDYFPIKGRKGELVLKRRSWKFEGVDKWLKREIDICVSGTKLEKEFADFLKEFDGDTTGMYQ